jgi:hypothetical protein
VVERELKKDWFNVLYIRRRKGKGGLDTHIHTIDACWTTRDIL